MKVLHPEALLQLITGLLLTTSCACSLAVPALDVLKLKQEAFQSLLEQDTSVVSGEDQVTELNTTFTGEDIEKKRSDKDLDNWLSSMWASSKQRMFDNISPSDAKPGCVIASPSRKDPDYYYYWVRDGALTMDTLVSLYNQTSRESQEEEQLEKILIDYMNFIRVIIDVPNQSDGVGEPKYRVNATAVSLSSCLCCGPFCSLC
jgi:hypothetical protein